MKVLKKINGRHTVLRRFLRFLFWNQCLQFFFEIIIILKFLIIRTLRIGASVAKFSSASTSRLLLLLDIGYENHEPDLEFNKQSWQEWRSSLCTYKRINWSIIVYHTSMVKLRASTKRPNTIWLHSEIQNVII